MDILIRKIKISEAINLITLMNQLGYSHNQEELTNNIFDIRKRGGEVFVARFDGLIIGCICSLIDTRLAAGKYGELVSLVVSGKHRGMGVGKQLVNHAEEWLSDRVSRIRVRANSIRIEAHGFYEALGYKEIKSQKILTKNV